MPCLFSSRVFSDIMGTIADLSDINKGQIVAPKNIDFRNGHILWAVYVQPLWVLIERCEYGRYIDFKRELRLLRIVCRDRKVTTTGTMMTQTVCFNTQCSAHSCT
ncbi:hypothetical protein TNCV_2589561 [Trichonephila clavipes]|nr:hypothetical protein TNCV_2589561 [Trichonephila clavipes]